MKKLVTCFIICSLLMTMMPINAFAEETEQRYTVEQMESIVNKYESNEDMLNIILCDDTHIEYWALINAIKQKGALTWALDMSSKLINEYPEKQDYVEILANLITMQSGELAEQIETQSRFDDLKNIGDYALDVAEIAAAFVGASGVLETFSAAIDTGVDGLSDVIIKNQDQAKYYEAILQDYSQSCAFLSAISQYAGNEELRNVASSLLSLNDTFLVKRLEYLADAGENIAGYEAEFLVENMSMELLKETELYVTDETVKWFVDESINLKNVLLAAKDAAEATFKLIILAGDIGFGTSDVYNRYQEMKIVADVASALAKANEAVFVPQQISEAKLVAIQEKCNYYKALLITHARGEYLLYQLLMNDAGAFSDFRWIIEYFKNPEDTTDAWYEGQINVLTKYGDVLDSMFVLDSEMNDSEILYAEILDKFYNFIQSGWIEYDEMLYYKEFCYLFSLEYSDPSYIDKIGYSFIDLNGDGVEELLIGMDADEETQYGENMIYDLYTYMNGKVVHLVNSGERYMYQLFEDNTIYYWGTRGAASNDEYRYRLDSSEPVLSVIEGAYSDPDENWDNVYWYHSTSGVYNPETSRREGEEVTMISEEAAIAICDGWPQRVDFPLTYFSEYTPQNIDNTETENHDADSELIMLTPEEQYRINTFLSYFSEQWFHEYSSEKFESENDPMDMVAFACQYLRLRGDDSMVESLMYNDIFYAGVSIEAINSVTQRFFNQTVTLEEIVPVQTSSGFTEYIILNDMVCFGWADGLTYNNMTVAKEMYDLGNGTIQVKFDIYSIDVSNQNLVVLTGKIKDQSVYYYTQTDAEAHPDFELHLSGVAVVKPYIDSNGEETYQLISYELVA